jgi:hypothetical protein
VPGRFYARTTADQTIFQKLGMDLRDRCRLDFSGLLIDSAAPGGLLLVSQDGTIQDVHERKADPIYVFPGA